MQTLRKLPIMEPNTKNATDQKWNGTAAQMRESKVAENMRGYSAIDILFQRPAHDLHRCGLAGPQLQSPGALIQQHAETVGGAAARSLGCPEQGGLSRPINHIKKYRCSPQCKLLLVKWQRIIRFQAERRRVQDQIDWSRRIAHSQLNPRIAPADF